MISKKTAKSFQLPSKVEPKKGEPKAEPLAQPQIQDTKANRTAEYNKAVDKLESFLERGLISKELFEQRFRELGKNLKDGGKI